MACFLCYSSVVFLENSSTSGISTVRPKDALEWTTVPLTGLKQQYVSGRGCLLSPDLFNINVFLENILAEAFEDCKKLGISFDGYKLKDLRFADDIALIADSENDLQTLIERVHDVSKKYRMEISIPKTKAMIFSHEDQLQVNIKLHGTSLDQVNRFKYLGVTLTPSNDSTSEIKSRLLLALTALGKLQKVRGDKDITLSTKFRILNALVYPILLYGSEICKGH